MTEGVSTYYALLAEFQTAEIPLEKVSEKFFGLEPLTAASRAPNRLPCPAYRGGSQKSPWLINAMDLAEHIDKKRGNAKQLWEKFNNI